MAGPGSIAHEWFHAFDHYIGTKLFHQVPPGQFASGQWLTRRDAIPHPLNQRLEACFKAILLDTSGDNPSDLFRQSAKADQAAGVHYYSQPEELCARAFEAFVQDAPLKNAFLVRGTKESEEARMGLYPQGAQRESINQAFQAYFHTLGRALQRTQA